MIFVPPDPRGPQYAAAGLWGRATLDTLFRRNLARGPDRLALADTADRPNWTDGAARRLTYAEADAQVSAVAARLQELGLKPGAVVGLQMPNLVEGPVALLACLRAGLVPALLPLLWRAREIEAALGPLMPRALITVTRAGDDAPADLLRYAAAELFTIRYVLAFGAGPPDGVLSLDGCRAREIRPASGPNPGDDPAVVTFRMASGGPVPVARSHNHCVSAGLAAVLETGMEAGDTILTPMLATGLAGLASGLLPWLLTGGALVLHQPFAADVFAAAARDEAARRVVVPAGLLGEIAPALEGLPGTVLAVHADARGAGRRRRAAAGLDVVDLVAVDEWAVLARRRRDGLPLPMLLGAAQHPTVGGQEDGPVLVETRTTPAGRLAVRGPMVPVEANSTDGFRLTGFAASGDDGALTIGTRLDGVAMVGGLAAGAEELESALLDLKEVEAARMIAMPDPLFGERIEVHVAPRATAAPEPHMAERLGAELAGLGYAAHKVPSRIVIDPALRADPRARRRARRGAPA